MDSEEKALWDHLEAHPTDSTCRLVFADWLEERGDLRAEGMRVLGRLGKSPDIWVVSGKLGQRISCWYWCNLCEPHTRLPYSWWKLFCAKASGGWSYSSLTRAECESAAAVAWLSLTQEQKDEILR